MSEGKAYAASAGVGPRVLFLLAAEGRIVRGRPLGSWTSTLYRWAPMEDWLPGGLQELDTDEAAAQLVARWLRAFGPGTYADLKWWTGWTAGLLKRALARVGPVEVALEGGADRARGARRRRAGARARASRSPRCCRRSIRRRWAGRRATGTSASTARGCSIAAATSARRSGGTGGSSVAGRSAPTARSRSARSRTWAARRRPRSPPRRGACVTGSVAVRFKPRFRTPLERELADGGPG